jgi:hypothetical protein
MQTHGSCFGCLFHTLGELGAPDCSIAAWHLKPTENKRCAASTEDDATWNPATSAAICTAPACRYVAMGCVATIGTEPPPRTCVKCLRADAACKASLGRTPLWLVRKDSRSLPPLAGMWLAA